MEDSKCAVKRHCACKPLRNDESKKHSDTAKTASAFRAGRDFLKPEIECRLFDASPLIALHPRRKPQKRGLFDAVIVTLPLIDFR